MASILEKKMTMWALKGFTTRSYDVRVEDDRSKFQIDVIVQAEFFNKNGDKVGYLIYKKINNSPTKFIYADTFHSGFQWDLGVSAGEFYRHMEKYA